MRIAYFDCYAGISGDMTIAAFLDAGLDMKTLTRQLAKLKIGGYELRKSKVRRGSIAGTKFDCIADRTASHSHRSVEDILKIIGRSGLKPAVKKTAQDIFKLLGEAESMVHGSRTDEGMILHELGDIDSIVDIVGCAIAIDEMGIDEVRSSAVRMGRCLADTRHGKIPVPSPAALELLKNIPVSIADIEAELVTPTGAAILKTLSKSFGEMPQIKIGAIGYGAGSRKLDGMANMLRVIIGDSRGAFPQDRISVIEANIDDMNPQNFEYVFERLFKEGALDVYATAIQMKKLRPAVKLTVLAERGRLGRLASVIFKETTTIGIRFYEAERFTLARKSIAVKTKYGVVNVKLANAPDGVVTVSPEYEDCVAIARAKRIPLKIIYDEAKRAVKAQE